MTGSTWPCAHTFGLREGYFLGQSSGSAASSFFAVLNIRCPLLARRLLSTKILTVRFDSEEAVPISGRANGSPPRRLPIQLPPWQPPTIADVNRRTKQGHSKKDIIGCVERFVARLRIYASVWLTRVGLHPAVFEHH